MTAAACGGETDGVQPLPRSICSELISAPGTSPELLVVSDLPFRGLSGTVASAQAMEDAVRLVIERRDFRAGRHRIAFQSCDDSTAAAGRFDAERCAGNGAAYASNARVIGVIGPLHSRCAEALLPAANRGGLPVVSHAATRTWLTRPVGSIANLPGRLYPTGERNFFRVAPPDDEQGRVAASLARRLGIERLFRLRQPDDYGVLISEATGNAARVAGLRLAGAATWDAAGRRAREIAREVRASGADGAHVSGVWSEGGAQVAAALRELLGARFPLIGSDGFVAVPPREARTLEGMWVTVPGLPASQLPAAGRAIVAQVGAGQPPSLGPAYAAQATEMLLDAIAASDGTRADVIRNLRATRLTEGPVGPMRFDEHGDPVPRHVVLYRIGGGVAAPVEK